MIKEYAFEKVNIVPELIANPYDGVPGPRWDPIDPDLGWVINYSDGTDRRFDFARYYYKRDGWTSLEQIFNDPFVKATRYLNLWSLKWTEENVSDPYAYTVLQNESRTYTRSFLVSEDSVTEISTPSAIESVVARLEGLSDPPLLEYPVNTEGVSNGIYGYDNGWYSDRSNMPIDWLLGGSHDESVDYDYLHKHGIAALYRVKNDGSGELEYVRDNISGKKIYGAAGSLPGGPASGRGPSAITVEGEPWDRDITYNLLGEPPRFNYSTTEDGEEVPSPYNWWFGETGILPVVTLEPGIDQGLRITGWRNMSTYGGLFPFGKNCEAGRYNVRVLSPALAFFLAKVINDPSFDQDDLDSLLLATGKDFEYANNFLGTKPKAYISNQVIEECDDLPPSREYPIQFHYSKDKEINEDIIPDYTKWKKVTAGPFKGLLENYLSESFFNDASVWYNWGSEKLTKESLKALGFDIQNL